MGEIILERERLSVPAVLSLCYMRVSSPRKVFQCNVAKVSASKHSQEKPASLGIMANAPSPAPTSSARLL